MQLLAMLHLLVAIEASRRPNIRHEAEPPESKYDQFRAPVPVDINHVRKEGLTDPYTGQKEPFDALATAMRFRMPESEMRRRIHEGKYRKKNQPMPSFDPDNHKKKVEISHKPPPPIDFEKLQAINIGIPEAYRANLAKTNSLFKSRMPGGFNQTGAPQSPPGYSYYPRDHLPVHPSDLLVFGNNPDNWTTCDEFAAGARFHPREVAGVVWELFYIWSYKGFPDHSRFEISYPTKKLVYDYKANYDKLLNVKVDWKQPMLLLRTWMEFLLIAADRRGLFIAIPKTYLPDHSQNMTVSHLTMRMKIVKSYLGMMICEEIIGLLLAPEGEVPPLMQRSTEAVALGFRGAGTPFVKNDFEDRIDLKRAETKRSETQPVVKKEQPHRRKSKTSPFFNDES